MTCRLVLVALLGCLGSIVGAKPPVETLVLPDGFVEFRHTEGRGSALISSKTEHQWNNDQGMAIGLWIDDSHAATNDEISAYSQDLVEQIKKQNKAGTVGSSLQYKVAGKNWIATTIHHAPETDRDLVVFVTQFKQRIAVIKVTALQKDYPRLKQVCARIIELNSP